MGKGSKRKKSFYFNTKEIKRQRGINWHRLEPGKIGFLCTTNAHEKKCVQEAYDILNEAANELYGEEQSIFPITDNSEESNLNKIPSSDNEDNIEDSLEAELKFIREASTNKALRRFQQVSTKTKNCIIISTLLDDPLRIILKIMDEIIESESPKTQALIRMTPIQKSCKANVEDIEKNLRQLLQEKLPKESSTYMALIKIRNNTSLTGSLILNVVNLIISEFSGQHTFNSSNPKFTIKIDVLKTTCCLAVLPDYIGKYCKYNLIEIALKKSKAIQDLEIVSEENQQQEDLHDNTENIEELSILPENGLKKDLSITQNLNENQPSQRLDSIISENQEQKSPTIGM